MNDLITALIIIAFIISFLNKIFGQKKQQQTRGTPQTPGQKPREWIPPWLEPDEFEIPDLDQMEVETETEILKPKIEFPSPAPVQQMIMETIHENKYDEAEPAKLQFDLSSIGELKKGIILAEILGQCKARKKIKKMINA